MRDDTNNKHHTNAAAADTRVSRSERVVRTTSDALLGTARELIIEHHGREYRLRLTQQGKLILTA
jgi:hemin uptake protein HemP